MCRLRLCAPFRTQSTNLLIAFTWLLVARRGTAATTFSLRPLHTGFGSKYNRAAGTWHTRYVVWRPAKRSVLAAHLAMFLSPTKEKFTTGLLMGAEPKMMLPHTPVQDCLAHHIKASTEHFVPRCVVLLCATFHWSSERRLIYQSIISLPSRVRSHLDP